MSPLRSPGLGTWQFTCNGQNVYVINEVNTLGSYPSELGAILDHVAVRCIKVIVEAICKTKKIHADDALKNSSFPNIMNGPDAGWIDWNAFSGWIRSLDSGEYSPINWQEVGAQSFSSQKLKTAISLINSTLSVRFAYWIAAKWFGPSQFRVILCQFEDIGPLRIRETLEVPTALEECPQVFQIFEGSLAVMPEFLFGLPRAKVTATITGRKAIYDIHFPEKNSFRQRFFHAVRNLTQQKKLFAELGKTQDELSLQTTKLVQERGEFKELFSQFPDGIIIFQNDSIVYVNDKIKKALHCQSSSELVGKTFLDFVTAEHHSLWSDKEIPADSSARHSCTAPQVTFKTCIEDEKYEAECTWMPFLFEGKLSTVVIARDISERKKHQSLAVA
ncbi:MAG: PAS domain S-box protein, partial [Bdellovibrionaceae bacterium]|nr:PAS domain S-box protein [Pseudobdellovibrionaceae bacterium]